MEVHSPTIHQPEQDTLFSQEEIPYLHNYELLVSDKPDESNEELRERYARYTLKLIEKVQQERPDQMIFLDKSARPVAWMFKELWPLFAQKSDDEQESIPEIKFLNIDREQWDHIVVNPDSGMIDVGRLRGGEIEDLRSIFTKKVVEEGSVENESTMLDGNKVMIVDEIRVSGKTLEIAEKMLRSAFPETQFIKEHWMIPELRSDGRGGMNLPVDQPVWYSRTLNTGRGVGDRKINKSRGSPSARQRRGGLFLSTPLPEKDEASDMLRSEIKHMANDIKAGRLLLH